MYTELPRDSIRAAASAFLQWVYTELHPPPPCHPWQDTVRRLTLHAIAFELDHIFFTVGDTTLQQRVCVSMGGLHSPATAMMVCIIALSANCTPPSARTRASLPESATWTTPPSPSDCHRPQKRPSCRGYALPPSLHIQTV